MVDYINKQDCERLGFIRLQDGTLYRQSVLEKYKSKGWLSFGNSRYSEDDRMKAGCRIAQDYYHGRFVAEGIIDYTKPRVDNSVRNELSPAVLDARTRFIKAMSCLDKKQSFVIRQICCENAPIKIPNIRKDQYIHDLELLKETVCRGLDCLIEHYWGKLKVPRPQIVGMATVGFWDDIESYYKEMRK